MNHSITFQKMEALVGEKQDGRREEFKLKVHINSQLNNYWSQKSKLFGI